MFHIASKLLTFLLMPAGIICILLLYAIYTKNRTKSKKLTISALIFFYLTANPLLINEILLAWEFPPTAISKVKVHDLGIILTGGTTNSNKLPVENIFLGLTSDRVGQTIQLYKKGKIKNILISGGEVGIIENPAKNEIQEIARYLIISGIPKEHIFLETHAKNTRENAVNVSRILKKQFPNQSYLLITSGFHLRRAVGCFAKVGIPVTPYGSNYLSRERSFITSILPWEDSLGYARLIFREIVGYCTYWILGWV